MSQRDAHPPEPAPPAPEPDRTPRVPTGDETAPAWVAPTIRRALWYALGLVVLAASVFWVVQALRGLLSMLVIAAFFAVAMEPGVARLHVRRGMSRAAATGLIFAGTVGSVLLFFFLLVPSITTVADSIGARLPGWLDQAQRTFHFSIGGATTGAEAAQRLEAGVLEWLRTHDVLGLASSGMGLLFQGVTIATFAFYLVVDAPRVRRLVLTRFPPERQQVIGWAWDTAIQQTGGFFYSRLLLGVIYTPPFFLVMLLLGVPWVISLALSVFSAFFAEFIPVVGTYIGAAIPIVVTLGLRGVWQAAVLLGWVLLYQQIENLWLAPKISARTMELDGAVAFGAAIAGGALGGPIGAFMALPVAALITSFLRTYARSYPLAYRSSYDPDPDDGSGTPEPTTA